MVIGLIGNTKITQVVESLSQRYDIQFHLVENPINFFLMNS